MRPNFPLLPVLRVCFILLILSTVFSTSIHAQRRRTQGIGADGDMLSGSNHSSGGGGTREDGWSVAINAGYETPDKNLKDYYNGAPTFGLTVNKRKNNWIFSAALDYRSYKPKQEVFLISDDFGDSYVAYSNFRGIGIYAGIAYDLQVNDAVDLYGGLNVGSVFVAQAFTAKYGDEPEIPFSGNSSVNYLGPKVGFNFAAGSNFSIGLEGRYGLNVTGFHASTGAETEVYKGFSAASANVMFTYFF